MRRDTKHHGGAVQDRMREPMAGGPVVTDFLQQGIKLHRAARLTRAISFYQKVIQLQIDHPDANHLIGLAMLHRRRKQDREKVLHHLEYAVSLRPGAWEFHNDLGNAYWNQGRVDDAAKAFQNAAALKPDYFQAVYNLGNARFLQDRFDDAISAFRQSVSLDPGWVQAHYRLANCLQYVGRFEEAIEAYEEAIKRKPELSDAHFGRAITLLKVGRFAEGWREYEHRLADDSFRSILPPGSPVWNGGDFSAKTLLVYGEQGIGDVLHFIRYLPMVQRLGGRTVLVCDSSLHPLLRESMTNTELLDKRRLEKAPDQIEFDIHVPLMSLPGIFATTPETIPCRVPYLSVNRSKTNQWTKRLHRNRINVGLVWAGNPSQKDDKHRSCRLADLAPLADINGVAYYSLQKGPGSEQLHENSGGFELIDFSGDLEDFSDTAALIEALDLLITVDTAVAHLAGGLACPVWVLLWFGHCWRYPRSGESSPWYPGMRLFRQPRIGDWENVATQAATALARYVSDHRK